jgi:rhamnose utilization protein RhaD (predicted bifunctional aldolase and dehydrogenase)
VAAKLFGDDAVVVDYVDPGVPLAREMERARTAYTERTGRTPPGITLLRSHGIIVAADDEATLGGLLDRLTDTVRAAIDAVPAPAADVPAPERVAALVAAYGPALGRALAPATGAGGPAAVASAATPVVASETGAGAPLVADGPLIPDQITYAGSLPVVLDGSDLSDPEGIVGQAVAEYRARRGGRAPVVAVVPGEVAFAAGPNQGAADNSLGIFLDALRVCRDANRIGRVRTLSAQEVAFIENWEAEAFRKKLDDQARQA